MSVRLSGRQVIGVKTESVEGTAIALAATDYILAQDVSYKQLGEVLERNYKRSSLDTLSHVVGRMHGEVSFKMEVKGSGTAGTIYAPLDAIMQACAFSSTVSAGVSVTYNPISARVTDFSGPFKTCTVKFYLDGEERVLSGCVGSWKLSAPAGKIALLDVTLRGKYTEPTAVAFPGTVTYLATGPALVASGAFTLHTYSAIVNALEIDLQNEIVPRDDVSSAFGIRGFMITGRNVVGSIDPEAPLVSAHNYWQLLRAGTTGTLSVAIGATAGNITTITAPAVQYRSVEDQDRNGIAAYNVGLAFRQSTGDDCIRLVQT